MQATVLKLLRSLRAEFNLTYLFISHDLAVVRVMCHRVAVMYLGKIVETAPTEALFRNPMHPYTRSLLSAIPQRCQSDHGQLHPDLGRSSPFRRICRPAAAFARAAYWPSTSANARSLLRGN